MLFIWFWSAAASSELVIPCMFAQLAREANDRAWPGARMRPT
jgi:hypothetical protein